MSDLVQGKMVSHRANDPVAVVSDADSVPGANSEIEVASEAYRPPIMISAFPEFDALFCQTEVDRIVKFMTDVANIKQDSTFGRTSAWRKEADRDGELISRLIADGRNQNVFTISPRICLARGEVRSNSSMANFPFSRYQRPPRSFERDRSLHREAFAEVVEKQMLAHRFLWRSSLAGTMICFTQTNKPTGLLLRLYHSWSRCLNAWRSC
jgi:hypothetical protein